MRHPSVLAVACAALASAAASGCSGASAPLIQGAPPGSDAAPPMGEGGSPGAPGPQVFVHVVAVQTPVPDTDGSARETPIDQRLGILGLELLRSMDDPSPLVVFTSKTPVDTGYNAGDDTLVGTAKVASLVAGTYLFARVPVAYTSFVVDGTYHDGAIAVPGQFKDTICLASNTVLDGASRAQGWWSASFLLHGTPEGTATGEGAVVGQPNPGSTIWLDMSQATAAYVFPVNLVVDPHVGHDVTIRFTVNTYEDFHWTDQNQPGYHPGVFDVSYGAFETVTHFGANSATVTME